MKPRVRLEKLWVLAVAVTFDYSYYFEKVYGNIYNKCFLFEKILNGELGSDELLEFVM
jgi:hypothetical protein